MVAELTNELYGNNIYDAWILPNNNNHNTHNDCVGRLPSVETLEAQVYTNNIHSLETTTMGEDMVDDESEDDVAEALSRVGSDSSRQKCNGGAPDEANTAHIPDG